MNKLAVACALLIMLLAASYFYYQKKTIKPQVDSLKGLPEELNSIINR
jgi:hypothetical protein